MTDRNYSGPALVIVGWDAGCWDYLAPQLQQGALPNLASLRNDGAYGTLRSALPALTSVSWTSIATGCNPGKHGIFSWWKRARGSYELQSYDSSSRRAPHLLEILSAAAWKVGAVGVPMTKPAFPVDGFLIGGITRPNAAEDWRLDSVYPASMAGTLRARHPEAMSFDVSKLQQANSNTELLDIWLSHERVRRGLIEDLVATERPDVLWVHCHLGDYFGHREPHDSEILQRAFADIDTTIGFLRQLARRDATVMVLSDHGQAPIRRFFMIQNWLEQQGLLCFKKEIPKARFGNALLRLLDTNGIDVSAEDFVQMLRLAAAAYYKLPPRPREKLAQAFLDSAPGLLKDHENIDWQRTKAYCCEPGALVRINLQGREPCGVVARDEYDSLVEAICRSLGDMEDPMTSRKLGIRAHAARDLYPGADMSEFPDIVCRNAEPSLHICSTHSLHLTTRAVISDIDHRSLSENMRFIDQEHYGDHTENGIYVVAGPSVRARGEQKPVHAVDIVPTLLWHLAIDPPSHIDGTARHDLIDQRH